MEKTEPSWPQDVLDSVAAELAREYPYISMALLDMVLNLAKTTLSPREGRVKLMAAARRMLAR